MKQVKNMVSKALGSHQTKQTATASAPQVCNYANNYYGDQVCVRCLPQK